MPRDRVSPIVSTPLGQERLLELRQLLAVGRDWTTSRQGMEPELALDFIERAGSALLLLRGLPETLKQMATRYGPPPTWSHSARTSRPLASITSNTGLIRPPVSVLDLLRSIGPGSNDDLDMALYAITTEIERQWAASYRRGTFAVGIGE